MIRRAKAAFTLIEMMVTVFVMSIVMIGIFQIFQEGMQLFRTNLQASDSQRTAIKVMALLSNELVNAIPEVSQNYDAGSGELPGVVFATPLDDNGATRFHPLSGKIIWQRYLAYYFVADPAPGGINGHVYRAEIPVTPFEDPPNPGNSDVPGVIARFTTALSTRTTTTAFAALPGAKKRVISDGVTGFDVTVYDGSEGRAGPATTDLLSYDITVEAGSPASQNVRNSYYIKVKSRISPRG